MWPEPTKRALVVEADPELKDLLARVLKMGGWAITNVPSNRDALSAVRERGYDLVITGVRTSAVEDVELLQKIRSVRPRGLPAIREELDLRPSRSVMSRGCRKRRKGHIPRRRKTWFELGFLTEH